MSTASQPSPLPIPRSLHGHQQGWRRDTRHILFKREIIIKIILKRNGFTCSLQRFWCEKCAQPWEERSTARLCSTSEPGAEPLARSAGTGMAPRALLCAALGATPSPGRDKIDKIHTAQQRREDGSASLLPDTRAGSHVHTGTPSPKASQKPPSPPAAQPAARTAQT